MRVVDVCAFYTPQGGGVRTYIDQKLLAAPRLGHEMIVLAPGATRRTELRAGGGRIEYIPAPRFPLDRKYRYFAADGSVDAALDALGPDLVECASPWRSASFVADWHGTAPRVMVMHADPLSAYAYRWFGDFVAQDTIDRGFASYWRHLRRMDEHYAAIVTANRHLAARMREGGLQHVELNPMGVTPGAFSPAWRDPALRRALLRDLGLVEDAILLIGAGRLASEKRWPMVVDAVMRASADRPLGLLLLGAGPERRLIERRIAGNPHIRLLRSVPRDTLARLLASSDALIHGCEAETFGLVAAEARASGLPVIAPDEGGASDQARECGEVYAAGDAGAAADAIDRLAGRLAPLRAGAVASAPHVRTMDEHFAALFARYAELVG